MELLDIAQRLIDFETTHKRLLIDKKSLESQLEEALRNIEESEKEKQDFDDNICKIQKKLDKKQYELQNLEDEKKLLEGKLKEFEDKYSQTPEDEIIYLTGMSINKKTFHAVYHLMSQESQNEFKDIKEILCSAIEEISKYNPEGKDKGLVEKTIENLRNYATTYCITMVSEVDAFIVSLSLMIYFHLLSVSKNNKVDLSKYNIFIENLFEAIKSNETNLTTTIKNLSWHDFFAVYQSNQSDSRGVNAIASEGQLHNKFILHYGYSDKPFYENLFINSLTLKFSGELLNNICSTNLKKLYQDVYQEHVIDIVLSKVLKNEFFDKSNENNSLKNKLEDLLNKDTAKVIMDSFENRNLFGIDLLSRFLHSLVIKLEKPTVIKIFVDTLPRIEKKENETKKEREIRKEREINRIKAFTKELWEYASSPEFFEFVDERSSAHITISSQYLNNQELIPTNETIDNNINNNPNTPLINIPIKMFISLPIKLDDNGNEIATRGLVIPERLVHNAKDEGTVNIYTVGGIEHNRPLMRLVNIHRQEKKDNRILGFFDNRFDYIHKFEKKGQDDFIHYFLMGANQPVSGLNAYHYTRFDDKIGNSISTDAKLIYFNIEEKNSPFNNGKKLTYHIISIYGFSALASAYATLWTIINIKESIGSINKNEGYKSSLAFKALDITDKNKLIDNINVFTKRVKFLPQNEMEKKLKEICKGMEPFSYLRLDYLNPNKEDRKLVKFMYGDPGDENSSPTRATAVVAVEDGSTICEQNRTDT